jgi:hypothetical protein
MFSKLDTYGFCSMVLRKLTVDSGKRSSGAGSCDSLVKSIAPRKVNSMV